MLVKVSEELCIRVKHKAQPVGHRRQVVGFLFFCGFLVGGGEQLGSSKSPPKFVEGG